MIRKLNMYYYTVLHVNQLQHTVPTTSHTAQEFWILYRDSTAGFGSSSLNKDKSV